MAIYSGLYDANMLKKTFEDWQKKVGAHKALETYRQILRKHNQAVESSVRSRIASRLHKFSGALSSSVRTNAKITPDGVYVSTYLANVPQEINGEKHGRYLWHVPQYAGFVNWGTKPHINHKKIRQSKIRKKIEREQAQIAKYQQKLSEHMQKSFLSSKIRLTGTDKKAEKYKKIIERYTSQLQKNLAKEREKNGNFTSFDDFCLRIPPRKANKRVKENLINAGAFDNTPIVHEEKDRQTRLI